MVQVLVLPHQSFTVSVTVVVAQLGNTVGLTLMPVIPQLSEEPPSTKAGVTWKLQADPKSKLMLGLQTATGGITSVAVYTTEAVEVLLFAHVAVTQYVMGTQGNTWVV
jgi:hypothetical protein